MRSLLVGWGNSTPRQLAAYARLHRRVGFEPEAVIPVTTAGLVSQRLYDRTLEPAREALSAGACMVHLFSDNGFLAWARLVATGAPLEAVRAVVLDSSPGLWAARTRAEVARRFSVGMTPLAARLLRREPTSYIPGVTPALYGAFLAAQALRPRAPERFAAAADLVLARGPRCPHVFLFGDEDILVPEANVRAYAARAAAHVDVHLHLFRGAGHVSLYPADPPRYLRALEEAARMVSSAHDPDLAQR